MSRKHKLPEVKFDEAWSDYQAAVRAQNDSARVQFKNRGVDESAWRSESSDPADPDTMRLRQLKLYNPALAIAEEAPISGGKIPVNREGIKKGYNPYDSGRLEKAKTTRRRNLRRLAEWLKLRKQVQHKLPEEN